MLSRKPPVRVALAQKMTRIAYALMAKDQDKRLGDHRLIGWWNWPLSTPCAIKTVAANIGPVEMSLIGIREGLNRGTPVHHRLGNFRGGPHPESLEKMTDDGRISSDSVQLKRMLAKILSY